MTKKEKNFTIIVDSREQLPYDFPKGYKTKVEKLDVGDYSIEGYEDKFAVERKSWDDWISSIGRNRKRFEKELVRGQNLEYFAVVMEWDLKNVWNRHSFSRMNRKAIQNTAIFWSVKYGCPFIPASDRTHGKIVVRELCNAWMKYKAWEETKTVSGVLMPGFTIESDGAFNLREVSFVHPPDFDFRTITYETCDTDEPPEVDE